MAVFGTVIGGRAIDGNITVSISGAVDTILTSDQLVARNIQISGALTSSVNVLLTLSSTVDPGASWQFFNNTSGAYNVTIKWSGGGSGTVVAQGKRVLLIFTGSDVVAYPTDTSAMGAAAKGANADISSLSAITGGVTIAGGANISGDIGGNSATPAPLTFGRLSLSVAGSSNVTLTAAQYAKPILEFTGVLTGNIQVILPLVSGSEWEVANLTSGAFSLTCIGTSGTGVIVTQGQRQRIYGDATNINAGTTDVPNLCVGNGTSITKIAKYTATYDPASLAAQTGREDTVTFTGVSTSDLVWVFKPTTTAGFFVAGAFVSGANTVKVHVVNATSGAVDAPSETYTCLAVRS
jgi:hypothetical protein